MLVVVFSKWSYRQRSHAREIKCAAMNASPSVDVGCAAAGAASLSWENTSLAFFQ